MILRNNPEKYNNWYHTQYGSWAGELEFVLLCQLMRPIKNSSLLDVGCGTGYFSRKFADYGLKITGIDTDQGMINFAVSDNSDINFTLADALELPFITGAFDYSGAITSLCFVNDPQFALREMWRVSKKGIVLGLLNRNSLLYLLKANTVNYKGARWDTQSDIKQWSDQLSPEPSQVLIKTCLFLPGMGFISKRIEPFISNKLLFGGFLAVYIRR